MGHANMDAGVFQETKLIGRIYIRGSDGYRVVVKLAPIRHRGRFTLLYRYSPNFVVEAIYRMPTGNGGEALLHCRILPGAERRRNDSGRRNGDELAAKGDRVDCSRGF